MIIDTSALVAWIANEPATSEVRAAIRRSEVNHISAANLVETFLVLDRARPERATTSMDDALSEGRIRVEAVTEEQARIAREANRQFGRGSGHRARLNFGDCFS